MNKKPVIAVLGSHSALDVCRGAKDEGFQTLVIAEKGRHKTYAEYYASNNGEGCVDECILVDKFEQILSARVQQRLIKKNAIFVPNRSFEAYLHFQYQRIEKEFKVPMFGNKFLLKIEERGSRPNQYDLLNKARIRYPMHFDKPEEIDRLVLVKVAEKERAFERAFFLANNPADFEEKSQHLLQIGKITEAALEKAVIEEYISGAQVNFNFFYSPMRKRVELMGTDTRRQTNLDGILRIPAPLQAETLSHVNISYEEAGHMAVTVLESLLEPAFALAESFVVAAKKLSPPGIIGPFALQSIIVPGPPKKDIVVVDISPRMPGSPGIAATPYGNYLYASPMTAGKRVAQEIHAAWKKDQLAKICS